MNVFVVTDNKRMFYEIQRIMSQFHNVNVDYYCSLRGESLFKSEINTNKISVLDLKTEANSLINKYELGISCHCKQIFPSKLVQHVRCINIHPGLNPYNRGWFPQVFSIINGLPAGATIHEMDEQIDHGNIIAQAEIVLNEYDTSLTAYERIQEKEIYLLEKNIEAILKNSYKSQPSHSEGNYNSIRDFRKLCKIELDQTVTMREALCYFRALTHLPYKNAYFIDSKGNKVFVWIQLEQESPQID